MKQPTAFGDLTPSEKWLALSHALYAVASFTLSIGVLIRLIEEKTIPARPFDPGGTHGPDSSRRSAARDFFS
jgi:hypothetical protein